MIATVTSRIEFDISYVMEMSGQYKLDSHHCKFEVVVGSDKSSGSLIITFEDLRNLMKSIIRNSSIVVSEHDVESSMLIRRFIMVAGGLMNPIVKIPVSESLCAEQILKYMTNQLNSLLISQYPDVFLIETRLRENNESYVTMSMK